MVDYLWLILFFPLAGFLINGLFGRKLGDTFVSWIGCGAVGLAFITSSVILIELLRLPAAQRHMLDELFVWMGAGDLFVPVGIFIDPLSAVMIMVVTGVGFIIHVYSVGYMKNDPGYARYFAYINLFIFSMLLLVVADSFPVMFVGWEGVGLCSYLLIGFWYEDKKNADAGKKAFIVNRIGDFGFLIAIFLIYATLGSVRFNDVFYRILSLQEGAPVITAITLLLFMGAAGKSAQLPLYVWLPDAMQGPTPVSSLIHAATMVTAGIYMIARCYVIFLMAPLTMYVIALVGVVTAIYAASISTVQNDIKRVLAYSTISQLGYMFLAVGVGAFASGMFHLVTHAFFKGLLFLGAGSVIHALSGEQDIRYMGNLRKALPVTFWTFFVAVLAITGVPGLSGFFSKDEILWNVFAFPRGGMLLWVLGIIGAGITAFYMFRLLYLTFFGESRVKPEIKTHIHESPKMMTVPLMILAVLSAIGGYIGIPHIFGGTNYFEKFLEPVFMYSKEIIGRSKYQEYTVRLEYIVMIISILVVLIGWNIVHNLYLKDTEKTSQLAKKFPGLYKVVLNKYYVDEFYHWLLVNPLIKGSQFLWEKFDLKIIDGAVNGTAAVIKSAGERLRKIQTGYVQEYALSMIIGAVILVGYFVLKLL